jgi:serine/threonine protein kinase
VKIEDGHDTGLARLLAREGLLPLDVLQRALGEVRRERGADDLSLSLHLVREGLLTPSEVEAALARTVRTETPSWICSQDFEVLGELGRGGMGVVHEVRHRETGARYALKRTFRGADPEERERFRREAQVLARLRHPGLVRIHSADFSGPEPVFVLELLGGGSLRDRLRRGPLPQAEALDIAGQVAETLGFLHEEGVIHRDLKPENVLFDDQGRARLTDFGLALARGAMTLTNTGEILGTPAFMSPEQINASHDVDERSDVYALGALLYTMLTGQAPFSARSTLAMLDAVLHSSPASPSELRPGLPHKLSDLCLRSLAKDPADRPASALAWLTQLRSDEQRPAPSWTKALAAGAALILGASFLWAALRSPSTRTAPSPRSPSPSDSARPQASADSSTDPPPPGAGAVLPFPWKENQKPNYAGLEVLLPYAREPLLRQIRRDGALLRALHGSSKKEIRRACASFKTAPRELAALRWSLASDESHYFASSARRFSRLLLPIKASPNLALRVLFVGLAAGDVKARRDIFQFLRRTDASQAGTFDAYTGVSPQPSHLGRSKTAHKELQALVDKLWERKNEVLPHKILRLWSLSTYRTRALRVLDRAAKVSLEWKRLFDQAKSATPKSLGALRKIRPIHLPSLLALAARDPSALGLASRRLRETSARSKRAASVRRMSLLMSWVAFDSRMGLNDWETWNAFRRALTEANQVDAALAVVFLMEDSDFGPDMRTRFSPANRAPTSGAQAWEKLDPTLDLLAEVENGAPLEGIKLPD